MVAIYRDEAKSAYSVSALWISLVASQLNVETMYVPVFPRISKVSPAAKNTQNHWASRKAQRRFADDDEELVSWCQVGVRLVQIKG